jgi:hypothetical protein
VGEHAMYFSRRNNHRSCRRTMLTASNEGDTTRHPSQLCRLWRGQCQGTGRLYQAVWMHACKHHMQPQNPAVPAAHLAAAAALLPLHLAASPRVCWLLPAAVWRACCWWRWRPRRCCPCWEARCAVLLP